VGEEGERVERGRAIADYQHFTQMALDFWKLFREEYGLISSVARTFAV
jgi:hypothetical protein